ncbi:hypothetical protein DFH11DRAFT_1207260 [Phellopilus nigrolimitatus]|nr:hypothetical protein DFH11DRAFT_1207260 [Phellopilus nigrolimitatus]
MSIDMQRKSIMPFESPDVPVIHRLSHELRSLDEYLLPGGIARGRSNDMAVALFNDSSKIAQDGIPLTVGRLRRLQNDLRSFSLLVDCRIACLKDAHQSLFAGVATLPNEILGHIFLAGCTPDAYGAFFVLAVSHVCRKFRAIALRMPSLWTILTNSQTEEQLAMFLERSKSLDLTISINDDPLRRFAEPGRLSLFDFRNLVRRYSDRLAEFRYVSSHNYEEEPDEECEDGEVEIIGYALVGQGFSRLKSVHIITERTFLRVPTIVSLENWTDYLFHLSWRAPALTYFRGVNVLPPYIYTDALTSCSLTFVEKVIPCLTDTLENLENLEKLSLELQSVQASDFELREVCLPSLQAFALIAGKGTSFSVLQQTTSMLELPSLEELSLTIKLEFTRKNIIEALTKAHVFPKHRSFPNYVDSI